jgi:heptosyltransferase I
MRVILTGGPSAIEREYADAILEQAQTSPLDLVGKTSLKELFALIGRASALISPDSGPVHMGTAAGTPVIGLFATTNPDRAGPYLSRQWEVNRYPDAVDRYIGKSVESLRWGTRVRLPEAMDLVTVEDVCARLRALAEAGFPRAGS